ncbi:MAG: 50S ribosomal protein L35 [Patescibacteria group bacterium]
MARKSVTKRIRITKTGKLMRRKMAQDHFRAKKTGKQIQSKRENRQLERMDAKVFLPYLTSKN